MDATNVDGPTCPNGHSLPGPSPFCPACGAPIGSVMPAASRKSKTGFWIGLGVAAVVVLGCAAAGIAIALGDSDDDESAGPTVLAEAVKACKGEPGDMFVSLEDDDETLLIDTQSEYGDFDAALCVFDRLDFSEATKVSIGDTTSMMGRQEADEDELHLEWSYHPDNGMNMIITLED